MRRPHPIGPNTPVVVNLSQLFTRPNSLHYTNMDIVVEGARASDNARMSIRTPATAETTTCIVAKRIYIRFPYRQRVEGLVVRGGRIIAHGARRALRASRNRGDGWLDLGDAVITPGLVDSHTHFFYWAIQHMCVIDVAGEPTLTATLATIRRQSRKKHLGDWVLARGFDINVWGTGFPTAADLDRAVSDRPVMVRSRDGHCAWLNTRAMQRVGIRRSTPDPPGGRYLRDRNGTPTGLVQEAAVDLLPNPVTELALRHDNHSLKIVDEALRSAYQHAWSFGLCGVHALDDAASLLHFQRHRSDGRLGLRIVHSIPYADRNRAIELGLCSGLGDDWLRIGAIKIFSDGTLGSRTALMYDAYPGMRGATMRCGVPVVAGDALRDTVVELAARGWAVWIHAIGDRAVHDCVTAIRAARRVEPRRLPHRIEHAQCARPADIRAMSRLGIIASAQPCHMLADIPVADRHWPRARRHAFPLRSFIRAGLVVPFGSDVPVEPIDPRRSLYAAVLRRDEQGQPTGGWFPGQRLSIEQALACFTEHANASVNASRNHGTLAVGSAADMTVWQDDPLTVPSERLREVRIRGCMIAGKLHLT